MNIRTTGIQIQIFKLQLCWPSKTLILAGVAVCDCSVSASASLLQPAADPQPVRQPLQRRAEPRPPQTSALLLRAQCPSPHSVLLPNISGWEGSHRLKRGVAQNPLWASSSFRNGVFAPGTFTLEPLRARRSPGQVGRWGDVVGVGSTGSTHRTRLRGGAGCEGKPRPA